MFEKIGFPVVSLKRIEFGGIKLGNLAEGKFVNLKIADVRKLKSQVGLV
jgi:16S rRNA U516 pseudouridylate synthase RsuA-like enzyme